MNPHWLAGPLALLLGGCVSPGMAPDADRLAQVKQAYVVAMQARPLGVPAGFRAQLPVAASSVGAARGLAVVNTIALFLEMPEASDRRGEASRSLQAAMDASGAWIPTVALASEVARQLAAGGVATDLAPQVKPLAGVEDTRATMTMENWLGPIRAHYNDPGPVEDYRAMGAGGGRVVIEASLSNYEILGESLLVQVHLKVIEPATGLVIGRARAARAFRLQEEGPVGRAFEDSAAGFKAAFAAGIRPLVRDCLAALGLLRT